MTVAIQRRVSLRGSLARSQLLPVKLERAQSDRNPPAFARVIASGFALFLATPQPGSASRR
jgi:hypothetical protein